MHPRIFGNIIDQYCRAEESRKAAERVALLRNDEGMTVEAVLQYVENDERMRKNLKWLCLDPYNQFETDSSSISVERKQGQDLKRISRFKDVTGIGVVLVCHPTKAVMGEEGKIREPTAYDVSGSAHFYNRGDQNLCITRHRLSEKVKLTVQKIRNETEFLTIGHVWMEIGPYGDYRRADPPEGLS